jgi:hypothetical protein
MRLLFARKICVMSIDQQSGLDSLFCSQISYQAGETLLGTAPHVDVWFLLEYRDSWAAKATTDNYLPATIQTWLNKQLNSVKNSRVQFIKQALPVAQAGIAFFVVICRPVSSLLYHFHLPDYESLLRLNIPAVVSGDSIYASLAQSEPLYLVCTNGKRDPCCALYGLPLYNNLTRELGRSVWQTTHLGGHRFAPTLVRFPEGVYYGRLSPEEVDAFVANQQRDQIYLENYRGRTCYSDVAQAADYFLRRETGQLELSWFRHLATHNPQDGDWLVQFNAPAVGEIHAIHLWTEAVLLPIYASCGKPQTEPITQYHFIRHKVSQDTEKANNPGIS